MRPIHKQFVIDAAKPELAAFRESLRALLAAAGFDEKKSGEVVLAVDERLTNIIRHGYCCGPGRIEVDVCYGEGCLKISVKDYGTKFNPLHQPAPKLPLETPGGLGIFLTRELMDEVVYDESFTSGNLLHLTKYKISK
ncbi:MAG: ATP-binding protein [Candidatus Omnitrophica bacterium]|nr:ATP-binding protein [Candidatus Omnitrophota bacterium]